jgi:hypothetical protein
VGDAVDAIEAALRELIEARNALPEEFATEIDRVITQARVLLDSLTTGAGQTAEPAAADGPA